jgi:MinD-like ATPase involved in chromosome partitioning or flagellar assembly
LNQGTVIALHSYKGGTGKTIISTNLAAILSREGKNVCLIDLDLRAPSLDKTFGVEGRKFWITDFLDGKCEPSDILFDVSKGKKLNGKLFVALANPSMEAIRGGIATERKREMMALRRLLTLKDHLLKKLAMDYVILDTSPGLSYASINSVTVADLVIVVATWDASDLAGAQGMVSELYSMLEKRTLVLMNKIPEQFFIDEVTKNRLSDQFTKAFNLPIVDLLPCYCEVLRQERSTIMALEKPEHPFSRAIVEVANRIEKR